MDAQPSLAPPADPAAQAFGRLADKIDLLETAIAGLAARRDAAPDYSETLGEITERLDRTRDAIRTLAGRPAMEITPGAMAAKITEAGAAARAADGAVIAQARDRFDAAASWIERLAGTIATIREQRRRLAWAAGGGLLAGMLLWSFLPGIVARAVPESWLWPERMAARTLRLDTWIASRRLAAVSRPETWNAMVAGLAIVQDNEAAIERCRKAAAKERELTPCTVRIAPEEPR